MGYPYLQALRTHSRLTETFGGYHRAERIGEDEFFDMRNMTADHYPLLASRSCRGLAVDGGVSALIARDGLCTVKDGVFCINGDPTDLRLSTDEAMLPKKLVGMGAYVIILPDKKYINTSAPAQYGDIDAVYTASQTVVAQLCDGQGRVYSVRAADTAPEDNTLIWVDTTTSPPTVRQYGGDSGWVAMAGAYIRLDCPGIGRSFAEYDGVELSGFADIHLTGLNGSNVVWARGEDYIVVAGVLEGRVEETAAITVSRTMPPLDHVVEYQNRLWGCFYGLVDGKPVNEIYASKQGDFKNWGCYMGVETDSYRVSCGTDGPFTGAVVVQNTPVFFKENYMHVVHGNAMPFRVQAVRCRGVEQGSAASLAVVDEVAYYKSREGICAYDGSLPRLVSQALGPTVYRNAVGGSYRGKYYVSMASQEGQSLFVYDVHRGLWHREDALQLRALCQAGGRLYGLLPDGRVLNMTAGDGSYESGVDFMVQTGPLGLSQPQSKYLHSLVLRLQLQGSLTVSVCYDQGSWQQLYSLHTGTLRSYELPIHPHRCDHCRLRLEGQGSLRLYSLQKTWQTGGMRP